MLSFNAYLERKPDELRPPACRIEKIIELTGSEFADLGFDPFKYRDFITENRDLMRKRGETYHCLLVLDKDGSDGILIEAEGSDYVRYGAYTPHARDYIENELERIAGLLLKNGTPDPETGELSIFLDDVAEHTGAVVTDDSDIARMFYRILQDHPAVAEIEAVDDCMVVTPASTQEQAAPTVLKLRDVLLLRTADCAVMLEDTDICSAAATDFDKLTQTGQSEYSDILDAAVKEIRAGTHGPEVIIAGVTARQLLDFCEATDAHEQAEYRMGDPTM